MRRVVIENLYSGNRTLRPRGMMKTALLAGEAPSPPPSLT